MKLVAGSYERFLWGWEVGGEKGMDAIFTHPAHSGPIKAMAAMGPVLATGSSDDTIKIFHLGALCDMGTLLARHGPVACLAFHAPPATPHSPTNLLAASAADPGAVCIWATGSWQLLKAMDGHRRGVADLTIHPSGRLALSVGRDSRLNMYDLLKGSRALSRRLRAEASLVRFCRVSGDRYCVAVQGDITVCCSEDGRRLCSLAHGKRVLAMAQNEDNILLTGGEDCVIRAWDIRSTKLAFSVSPAHQTRIRGVALMGSEQSLTCGDTPFLFASASSDGVVRVWDARMAMKIENEKLPTPVMETETNSRLTCLLASSVKSIKRKSKARKACLQEGSSIRENIESCKDEAPAVIASKLEQSAVQVVIKEPAVSRESKNGKIRRDKRRKKKMRSMTQDDQKKPKLSVMI